MNEPIPFYVSPVGNDVWSGRRAEPYATPTDGPLFILQTESPAPALGFRPIDTFDIGPCPQEHREEKYHHLKNMVLS